MMRSSPDTKLAPEGGFMAVTIFLLLNGLGVIFLLYVLARFWNEGRRQEYTTRQSTTEFLRSDAADVFVVTHPISHSACGGLSVIPVQAREFGHSREEDYRRFVDELDKMPIETRVESKKLSTK